MKLQQAMGAIVKNEISLIVGRLKFFFYKHVFLDLFLVMFLRKNVSIHSEAK